MGACCTTTRVEDGDGESLLPPPWCDSYQIRGRLGEGMSGTVYAARHCASGRAVAIKIMLRHLGSAQKEAHVLCKLQEPGHPGIVQVGPTAHRPFSPQRV